MLHGKTTYNATIVVWDTSKLFFNQIYIKYLETQRVTSEADSQRERVRERDEDCYKCFLVKT